MSTKTNAMITEIIGSAVKISDPAGRAIAVINDFDTLLLARRHQCEPRRIHVFALEQNIWPRRYIRNFDSLTPTDQIKLLETRVIVVGAGGLGGYVLQLLARIGLGTLVAVDPETFDETNLNRQAMARTDTLDEFKADTAARTLSRINPTIEVIARTVRIAPDNIDGLLHDCHVAVDALDNAGDRLILQESCTEHNIPLVHGTIAGFEGRVMTVFPGDPGLHLLYGRAEDRGEEEAAELRLGVPAIAPALVASLQVMEVLKIVLNRGKPFRNGLLHADLENGQFEKFRFE